MARDVFRPLKSSEEAQKDLEIDINVLTILLEQTCYLNDCHSNPKEDNLHLAWKYTQSPADYHRFINMLHVITLVFNTILNLIQDHSIFHQQFQQLSGTS
jgi:hypothetical protein